MLHFSVITLQVQFVKGYLRLLRRKQTDHNTAFQSKPIKIKFTSITECDELWDENWLGISKVKLSARQLIEWDSITMKIAVSIDCNWIKFQFITREYEFTRALCAHVKSFSYAVRPAFVSTTNVSLIFAKRDASTQCYKQIYWLGD